MKGKKSMLRSGSFWFLVLFAGLIFISKKYNNGVEDYQATQAGIYVPMLPNKASARKISKIAQLHPKVEKLIGVATDLKGVPYMYSGMTPKGFDCSGFTSYVYGQVGENLPHSSIEQSKLGDYIKNGEVLEGDLVFFTGTDLNDPNVGHVGIVISTEKGKAPQFIHASSTNGVRVDSLTKHNYKRRFLFAKRVIG